MKYSKQTTVKLKKKMESLQTMAVNARSKGDQNSARIFSNEAKSIAKDLVRKGTF